MLPARTTSAHSASSRSTRAPSSAGVIGRTTAPCSSALARNSGAAVIAEISAAKRSTSGAGVAAGAKTANQASATKPGRPASAAVGTSGSAGCRSRADSAMARS